MMVINSTAPPRCERVNRREIMRRVARSLPFVPRTRAAPYKYLFARLIYILTSGDARVWTGGAIRFCKKQRAHQLIGLALN